MRVELARRRTAPLGKRWRAGCRRGWLTTVPAPVPFAIFDESAVDVAVRVLRARCGGANTSRRYRRWFTRSPSPPDQLGDRDAYFSNACLVFVVIVIVVVGRAQHDTDRPSLVPFVGFASRGAASFFANANYEYVAVAYSRERNRNGSVRPSEDALPLILLSLSLSLSPRRPLPNSNTAFVSLPWSS